jgi:uncharacterized membrane protein
VKDFHDLERAHEEGRLPSYDAAVVEHASDAGHRIVATTIDPDRRRLLRGAGLGLVLGIIYSPALAVAAAGATIGAVVGHIVDEFASLKHADMEHTHRLIDDSAANLIVICNSAHSRQLESIASSRAERTIVPLLPADIEALKNELPRQWTLLPGA